MPVHTYISAVEVILYWYVLYKSTFYFTLLYILSWTG